MHTPGPWKIVCYDWEDKGGGNFVGHIEGPNGDKIYAGAASFNAINNLDNARLIAAAPELLEACKHFIAAVRKFGDPGVFRSAISHAENAIAKAEGE